MKKILSIVFAFVLIFSCFAISTVAFSTDSIIYEDKAYFDSQPVVTFSDDFKKMYVDDEPFSRANLSMLSEYFGYVVDISDVHNPSLRNSVYVDLTDAQKQMVVGLEISTNEIYNMYWVEMNLGDGSSLTVYFIQDEYIEDYNNVIKGNGANYVIDFVYPENNVVLTTKTALEGEMVTINQEDVYNSYDIFYVDVANEDLSVSMTTGVVFEIDDAYYYFNYIAAGFADADVLYYGGYVNGEELTAYKITDEKLLADIDSAMKAYYDDDYGIFFDKETSEFIAMIALVIIFVVVPAIVFVIFLIKAIRGKGVYKKLYSAIAGLCVAEIVVFLLLASIIYPAISNKTEESIIGSAEESVVIDVAYNNDITDLTQI